MRVLFWSSLVPLTVNSSDRAGLVGMECELTGGAKPGSIAVHLLVVPAQRHRQVRQLRRDQGLRGPRRCRSAASGGSALTVTVSPIAPTSSVTSTRVTLLMLTVTAVLLEGLEALLAGLQAVDAGGQVGEVVMPRRVGDGLAGQAGALVGDDDGGAGNRGARGVLDVAEDRSVQHLRVRPVGNAAKISTRTVRQTHGSATLRLRAPASMETSPYGLTNPLVTCAFGAPPIRTYLGGMSVICSAAGS